MGVRGEAGSGEHGAHGFPGILVQRNLERRANPVRATVGRPHAALQVALAQEHGRVDGVAKLREWAKVLVGVDDRLRIDELLERCAAHAQATRVWTARLRKLLSRMTSSTGRVTDGGTWPFSTASSSIAAAKRPISADGCATVVKRGFASSANGMSSNPTTVMSSGTR